MKYRFEWDEAARRGEHSEQFLNWLKRNGQGKGKGKGDE